MSLHAKIAAFAAALLLSLPAAAQEHPAGLHIHDVYARITAGGSGAVFLMIHNNTDTDDRLLAVRADIAEKVELHTHVESADGVMQMTRIEGGIPLPAGEMHALERGGDHVMLMGLTQALQDGDSFPLTLTFEQAGDITVTAVVDNARAPGDAHDHSGHGDGHDQSGQMMQHGHDAHGHGGHDMATLVDQTGMTDHDAILAVMKAQFDTPENPLTINPVVIHGQDALASWEQGGKGGRALLRKSHDGWAIVLCGGQDLRMPAFLDQHGTSDSAKLSALFNAAEDALGSEKVALYSAFEGVVMVAGH